MIDQRRDFLGTYRQCRLGFLLLAIGLVPACLLDLLWVVGRFGDLRILIWAERLGLSTIVATLTPWATLAGATVLWGAWDHKGWQRRAGLLLTMCLVDVGSWFLDLGDPQMRGDHAWFRHQLGSALGWAQFALLAGLSGDVLAHLGVESAEESSKSTRSLAATGAMVWLLLFCETANLEAGWPLQMRPRFSLHAQLLWMGNTMIHTICLIQVAALVVAALRRVDEEVRSVAVERTDDEPEGPRLAFHQDLSEPVRAWPEADRPPSP
ncbi:hypothetical protein [Planctomyces sp. SH-PL62]|uniref:hypothetical protein n=1 Tax=Planctomyces sp. SH-PL62 TaxID=1636152 RepID=UPI00078CF544|nr:hypothetical protein [Planctomyces sp. SH-PL62]AMV36946.1 hypothetical protein VT85_05910 [Planctomyces sp. SH-PL62]